MSVKRHTVKSCCGAKSFVFEIDKAVRKTHMPAFNQAGYASPAHFARSGLFYIVKPGFVASASFGSTKIQVRATGANAIQILDDFEKLLESLIEK